MRIIPTLLSAAGLIAGASVASALAEESCCVDADIAEAFLPRLEFSRRVPDVVEQLGRAPEAFNLVLPEGAPARHIGSGGGGDLVSMRARTLASSTVSIDVLLQHFEAQLQRQGWRLDTTHRGADNGGSVWMRRAGGRMHLGHLTIIERDMLWLRFSIDRPAH